MGVAIPTLAAMGVGLAPNYGWMARRGLIRLGLLSPPSNMLKDKG